MERKSKFYFNALEYCRVLVEPWHNQYKVIKESIKCDNDKNVVKFTIILKLISSVGIINIETIVNGEYNTTFQG